MIFLYFLLMYAASELFNWAGAGYGTLWWWVGMMTTTAVFLWRLNRFCKISL